MSLVQSDLHGMVPVVNNRFQGLQQTALRWPNGLRQAAAVCNSLTLINKSHVVGDFGERRAFQAVEARFTVSMLLWSPATFDSAHQLVPFGCPLPLPCCPLSFLPFTACLVVMLP